MSNFFLSLLLLPAVALATDLPDPLTFSDGRKVTTASDWPARRAELLEQFQQIEYGHLPPVPKSLTSIELLPGKTHRQFKITLDPGTGNPTLSFVLDLTTPPGPGPFPVILAGDWCWHKTSDEITKLMIDRGYALAEFNRLEFAPDTKQQTAGLYASYPNSDFGALAAWAYGYHRSVDFLLTLPDINKDQIAITGHSRGGKAILFAGATDTRIALTNPAGSGCGGAGCFRDTAKGTEDLASVTRVFPYWFSPKFKEFAHREADLPFDQHELKALVAPRALLSCEGMSDPWANIPGTFRTYLAAQPVFNLLGVPDHNTIHFRPGPHEHNLADYTALLDYADYVFHNKPLPADLHPTTLPSTLPAEH